jgi:hypothetical protein
MLSDVEFDPMNTGSIQGTFSWTSANPETDKVGNVLDGDSRLHSMTFTPDDSNFQTAPVSAYVLIDVAPAALSITGLNGITKEYDGTDDVIFADKLSFVGLQYGETATVDTSDVTAKYESKNVSNRELNIFINGKFAMGAGTADPGNYTITQPTGAIRGSITSIVSDGSVVWPTGLTARYGDKLGTVRCCAACDAKINNHVWYKNFSDAIFYINNDNCGTAGTINGIVSWVAPNYTLRSLGENKDLPASFDAEDHINYTSVHKGLTVNVLARDINNDNIKVVFQPYVYDNFFIPEPTVTDMVELRSNAGALIDTVNLISKSDYWIEFREKGSTGDWTSGTPRNAGEYEVRLHGYNNYTGVTQAPYHTVTITKAELTPDMIKANFDKTRITYSAYSSITR